LIADEVITGFGRTGNWFGSQTFGIRPHIMTIAKGLSSGYQPIGGSIVCDEVAEVVGSGGEFFHGYTYSGHPVACAVALANIDLMARENLPGRVRDDVGPYLAEVFATFKDHPLVGDAETCGFVGGLVLVQDKATRQHFPEEWAVGMMCRAHCFGNGLVMRAVGDRMIIAPPLTMTRAQIDEMSVLIRKALDLTLAELRAQGKF
jgi:putrescine aminotransferase